MDNKPSPEEIAGKILAYCMRAGNTELERLLNESRESGVDFYSLVTARVLDKDITQVREERVITKNILFGFVYGVRGKTVKGGKG